MNVQGNGRMSCQTEEREDKNLLARRKLDGMTKRTEQRGLLNKNVINRQNNKSSIS